MVYQYGSGQFMFPYLYCRRTFTITSSLQFSKRLLATQIQILFVRKHISQTFEQHHSCTQRQLCCTQMKCTSLHDVHGTDSILLQERCLICFTKFRHRRVENSHSVYIVGKLKYMWLPILQRYSKICYYLPGQQILYITKPPSLIKFLTVEYI